MDGTRKDVLKAFRSTERVARSMVLNLKIGVLVLGSSLSFLCASLLVLCRYYVAIVMLGQFLGYSEG